MEDDILVEVKETKMAEQEVQTEEVDPQEVDKQKELEKKINQHIEKRKQENKKRDQGINLFSARTYGEEPELETKKQPEEAKPQAQTQNVIDKPNFDMLETLNEEEKTKVFKIEKIEQTTQPKPKRNRFKYIMIAILFAIFGTWGIVNISQIDILSKGVSEVSTEYSVNLGKYLLKLKKLDATSTQNMQNLLETIPEAGEGATQIKVQSNWFDRMCDFVSKLFIK